MTWDYFEELLKTPSIFLDESKLDINFVPELLPYREKELSLLSQSFLTLITNPNATSRKILITGKTGVGKTAIVKVFGKMLTKAAEKRDIPIKYVHVNCRKERTSYTLLIKIIQALNKNFIKKGYSPQDLLDILFEYLNDQDSHLLLVLDELSYLINRQEDLIYSLTRVSDDSISGPQRISIIGIVRDPSCINNLDPSTLSAFQRNIIHFKAYSKAQIFDMLHYRAEISIKRDGFTYEIIDMISNHILQNGDIRFGLNILWKAGKIAEKQGLSYITPECVRLSIPEKSGYDLENKLELMSSEKLIFLLSIITSLESTKKSETSLPEILEIYKSLCETKRLNPRSYSQIWNFLQDFKKENIVSVNVKSESIKGRMVYVAIQNIDLKTLNSIVIKLLNSKGISFEKEVNK